MPSLGAVAEWLLPYRVFTGLRARKIRRKIEHLPGFALAKANASVANIHRGERCFILCNGPSINRQALSLLRNEVVLSVSSAYHHPQFLDFRPRYHCLPQMTYGLVTEGDAVRWFREMDARIGDAEVFMSSTEEPLVRSHGLFAGRTVRYLFFHDQLDYLRGRSILDISRPVPHVQSAPIMCLMVAMYLGFKKIYLLGTEHDSHRTGVYKYFYGNNLLSGKDPAVDASGRIIVSQHDLLNGLATLWRQYRVMREIAEANGVTIFNATDGGLLDEFARVRFEDLFIGHCEQLP